MKSLDFMDTSTDTMECDNICEPAPPGDNDGVVSDNIAAATSPVAENLVWKDRLRQRVRPEDRPVKNPWSVLDPHSPTKETKQFRKEYRLHLERVILIRERAVERRRLWQTVSH